MTFSIADMIGTVGVTLLLLGFLLNLVKKISQSSLSYILLNFTGAALACIASVLIDYIPFVILEGTWALVSLAALINFFRKEKAPTGS